MAGGIIYSVLLHKSRSTASRMQDPCGDQTNAVATIMAAYQSISKMLATVQAKLKELESKIEYLQRGQDNISHGKLFLKYGLRQASEIQAHNLVQIFSNFVLLMYHQQLLTDKT